MRAKQSHPDMQGGDCGEFARVRYAYETLIDPAKRADYDRELEPPSSRHAGRSCKIDSEERAFPLTYAFLFITALGGAFVIAQGCLPSRSPLVRAYKDPRHHCWMRLAPGHAAPSVAEYKRCYPQTKVNVIVEEFVPENQTEAAYVYKDKASGEVFMGDKVCPHEPAEVFNSMLPSCAQLELIRNVFIVLAMIMIGFKNSNNTSPPDTAAISRGMAVVAAGSPPPLASLPPTPSEASPPLGTNIGVADDDASPLLRGVAGAIARNQGMALVVAGSPPPPASLPPMPAGALHTGAVAAVMAPSGQQ